MNVQPDQNILHRTFGFLTVVDAVKVQSKTDGRFRTKYKCECVCGNSRIVEKTLLIKGRLKSCGCRKQISGPENPRWMGHGEISRKYFQNLKHHAEKLRGIEFDISIEEMWDLFIKQNRTCALSGVALCFRSKNSMSDGSASLDRIDSSLGYKTGNIQWIHKDINWMKHVLSQDGFLDWVEKIYNYNAARYKNHKDSKDAT